MNLKKVEKHWSRAALPNLVAIRHMWQMALLMWRQPQFLDFYILGRFKNIEAAIFN